MKPFMAGNLPARNLRPIFQADPSVRKGLRIRQVFGGHPVTAAFKASFIAEGFKSPAGKDFPRLCRVLRQFLCGLVGDDIASFVRFDYFSF